MPRVPRVTIATSALLALGSTCLAQTGVPGSGATPADRPGLQEELDEFAAAFAARVPESMQRAFAEGVADVRRLGLLESAKNVGDAAATRTLETPNGDSVEFMDVWADGPIVLTFYRGGWCPYCNLQLRALQRSLDSLEGCGATLVAVTPELPEKAAETIAKNDLEYRVLTDRGNGLAREFGIVFTLPAAIRPIYAERVGVADYNGDDRDELPLAATYVIDPSGVIRWAWLDADYRRRAEPADIIAAVRTLDD
ncbi:MAG: peroxiredoxin-like family protein [Planctomycetota bacterium]